MPRYRISYSVQGRIRFLSHLETVDTLLAAVRRAGFRYALSQGMKPKPLIKLALPRPVGMESERELAEVALLEDVAPSDLAQRLQPQLPAGMHLGHVEMMEPEERSDARRVAGAAYRLEAEVDAALADDDAALGRLSDAFRSSPELLVQRVSPKQRKTLDIREFVEDVSITAAGRVVGHGTGGDSRAARDPAESTHREIPATGRIDVRYVARLTAAGSVKAEEVLHALTQLLGQPMTLTRAVRESILVAGDGPRAPDAAPSAADPAASGSAPA